jgi:hypothetical protein
MHRISHFARSHSNQTYVSNIYIVSWGWEKRRVGTGYGDKKNECKSHVHTLHICTNAYTPTREKSWNRKFAELSVYTHDLRSLAFSLSVLSVPLILFPWAFLMPQFTLL